jgi:integrase
MGHVQDLWYSPGEDGKDRPTGRHGHGKRWKARYRDPEGTGRSRSFTRKTDAENFLTTIEADILRGTYLDPDAGKITLRAYTTEWLASRSWDAGARQVFEARVNLHILPHLGASRLDRLAARPSVISGWAAGLPVSPRYAGHILSTLSSILGAAVDDGLIGRNSCRATSVRAPKVPRRKLTPWDAARVAAVRAELPQRYRAMADAGTGLGLRQGEIIGLPVDAVDFLRRSVRVRSQVRLIGKTLVFAPPKGGRERDVPLPEGTGLALAAHIAAFPPRAVTLPWLEPGGAPRTETLVFTSRAGVIHRCGFNADVWRPARRRAGVPDHRDNGVHALRHHYASVLLAGGVDTGALSEYLGHHDPGFTLRVYRHLLPHDADTARKAVEVAIARAAAEGPGRAQAGGERS